MKIFKKVRYPNGRRHIYLMGIKIISYRKDKSICVSMFKSDIYKYKAFTNCNSVDTVILGSSHGRDGYTPTDTSFNLANSSQDLYRAAKVYEFITTMPSKCNKIKNIVLFWSVFHPGLQLEKTREYLKCIPYKLFYNANYAFDFPIDDRKILCKLRTALKKTPVSREYRGESFYDVAHNDDTAMLVEKHIKNTKRRNNQIQYLHDMAVLGNKYKHNIYIVLPPYRQDYLDCLPDDKDIYFELFEFLATHPEIKLLNFQRDGDFIADDFDSADHCNIRGAQKLSNKINNIIYGQ